MHCGCWNLNVVGLGSGSWVLLESRVKVVSFFRRGEALVSGVMQVVVSPVVGVILALWLLFWLWGIFFGLFVCLFSAFSELADESCELNGHQDLLFTPLVSSDSPLRPAPTRQVTEEYLEGSILALQLLVPRD